MPNWVAVASAEHIQKASVGWADKPSISDFPNRYDLTLEITLNNSYKLLNNPVKHNYVTMSSKWPYSSIHRYVRLGLLPVDWASEQVEHASIYGE